MRQSLGSWGSFRCLHEQAMRVVGLESETLREWETLGRSRAAILFSLGTVSGVSRKPLSLPAPLSVPAFSSRRKCWGKGVDGRLEPALTRRQAIFILISHSGIQSTLVISFGTSRIPSRSAVAPTKAASEALLLLESSLPAPLPARANLSQNDVPQDSLTIP